MISFILEVIMNNYVDDDDVCDYTYTYTYAYTYVWAWCASVEAQFDPLTLWKESEPGSGKITSPVLL